MEKVQLRTYVFIDNMQPQFAAYSATSAQGYLPVEGQAALYVEISPGMEINRVMDIALKNTNVTPAELIVERQYGMLEVHSDSQGDVRQAGQAILDALNLKEEDRIKPKIISSQIIRNVDSYQAMLINREVYPAGYATLAANEAEKAANINIVVIRAAGAFGRIYLAGEEKDVVIASEAAVKAIESLTGSEEIKKS